MSILDWVHPYAPFLRYQLLAMKKQRFDIRLTTTR